MRGKTRVTLALGTLGLGLIGGCPANPLTIETKFPLVSSLGQFTVEANVAMQQTGVARLNNGGFNIGSGSVELSPADISIAVASATGGKGSVNFQGTSVLTVTVRIDDEANLGTVCGTGDEYGPYNVTLDENFVPVSVDPNQFTLTQTTRDLLNLGRFSLCVEVLSPVTGTVTVDSLTLNLGL
ncbi:MAG: hypothetical protein AABZ47_06005 [Planctomycetota bacterium]